MNSRDEKIISMRHNDLMTLQEIASKFDISRERVRQIVGNTGWKNRITKRNETISKSTKCTGDLAESYGLSYGYITSLRSNHHDVKEGNLKKGQLAERYVSNILYENEIDNKLMPVGHSFDILALENVKIDVKGAFTSSKTNPKMKSPQWHFHLKIDQRGSYFDFVICVIWETKDCFVIPLSALKKHRNNLQDVYICWPTKRPEIGRYQKYHNRWDLIKKKSAGECIDLKEDVYIGRSIKRVRNNIGMTRTNLSRLSGIGVKTIIQIENKPTKRPSDPILTSIMSALGVTLNDLMKEE